MITSAMTLTSCKINLEMVQDRISAQAPELGAQVENAKAKVIQVLKDIKEISHGLMPRHARHPRA